MLCVRNLCDLCVEFFVPRIEKDTQKAQKKNKEHLCHYRIVATAFSIAGDPSVAPTAPIGIILVAGQARPIRSRSQEVTSSIRNQKLEI